MAHFTGERVAPRGLTDRQRPFLLGPDAVLTSRPGFQARDTCGIPPPNARADDWMLELYEQDGNLVRVLIVGGEE
jgi:hypothetical protein